MLASRKSWCFNGPRQRVCFAYAQSKKPERFGIKGLLVKHAGPEGGNQLVNNENNGNQFSRDKKLICAGVHILPNSTGFASITNGYWRLATQYRSTRRIPCCLRQAAMALTVAAVVTTSSIIVTQRTFLVAFESWIANAALRFLRRALASANSVYGVVL